MKFKIGKNTTAFIFIVAFCLLMAAMTLVGFSDSAPEIVFFIYLIGMTIFLFLASGNALKTPNDKILFFGAFFIKVVYAIYRFPFSEITNPGLGGDAGGFWRTAIQYYEGNFSRVYTPFPYFLNFEFHIFGKNVLCCCLTNIALSMLMVLLVMQVLNKHEVYGKGRFWAVLIAAFLVYGIQVSNSILRESIYFALITASFYEYIQYLYSRQQLRIYMAVVLMIPVLMLHIGYFPIVGVYIIDIFLNEKVKSKKDLLNRTVIVVAFIAFIVFASQFNSVGYLTKGNGIVGIINKISGANSDAAMGEAGSRYLAGLRITSIPTFILYSPIKWIYFMFSPLPTNWRGITDIAAFILDGCVHFICIWMTIKCLRMLKRNNQNGNLSVIIRVVRTGLWAVILCGFVFGLGTGTAGTAIRHRDVMIGIEAILISLSIFFRSRTLTDYVFEEN